MGTIDGKTVGKSVVAERTVGGRKTISIVLLDREPLLRELSAKRTVSKGAVGKGAVGKRTVGETNRS